MFGYRYYDSQRDAGVLDNIQHKCSPCENKPDHDECATWQDIKKRTTTEGPVALEQSEQQEGLLKQPSMFKN